MDNKQIPNKLFFKIGEVCEITDTQPYVLRYWESEFPALAPAKNSSGQRIYRRKDIETVLRIKQLLYEEGFTIAGAKKRLETEMGGRGTTPSAMANLPETVVTNVAASVPEAPAGVDDTRALLMEVRDQLRGMLTLLDKGDRKVN
jgi:DNA-binding transcriptional MerR regulator